MKSACVLEHRSVMSFQGHFHLFCVLRLEHRTVMSFQSNFRLFCVLSTVPGFITQKTLVLNFDLSVMTYCVAPPYFYILKEVPQRLRG